MKQCIIFDLDQTLVDSSKAQIYRDRRDWKTAVSLIPQFTLYTGMNDVFDFIRQNGIKVAVVSTSVSFYVNRVISYFNIPCDYRIAYHDVTRHKPDSECMNKVLKFFNLNSQDVISIGDRDIDIIASKNAGIFSIGCTWGNAYGLGSSTPDVVISNPLDIINYL